MTARSAPTHPPDPARSNRVATGDGAGGLPGRTLPGWRAPVVLACAVLIAWAAALGNGFVWDDPLLLESQGETGAAVLGSAGSHAPSGADGTPEPRLSLRDVPRSFTRPLWTGTDRNAPPYYRPTCTASMAIDSALWGLWAPGFHLTNLLIHFAVGWLIFSIARRLLGGVPMADVGALAAACLYVVHPAHVGKVAYISGRTDSLALMFALAALRLHLFPALSPAFNAALSGLCTVLAMMSKEPALLLPAVIVLIDLLPARRAAAPWPRRLLATAPHFAALAAVLAIRAAVTEAPFAMPEAALSPGVRLLTGAAASLFYVKTVAWPGLATNYQSNIEPVTGPLDPDALVGLANLAALVALGLLLFLRRPASRPGLVFAAVYGLVVALATPQPAVLGGAFPAGERFLYFPLAGVAIALAGPATGLARRVAAGGRDAGAVVALSAAAAVFVAWSVCSEVRAMDWRSPVSLFTTLAKTAPRSGPVHYNLGQALAAAGRADEAIAAYERAVELAPGNVRARNNLALLYDRAGRFDEAEAQYRAALAAAPSRNEIRFNLAEILHRQGRLRAAIGTYREALRHDPAFTEALVHLGDALRDSGDARLALVHYLEATRTDPAHGEARARHGAELARQGRLEDGIAEMREGLRLDPADPSVRTDLGAALLIAGRPQEALEVLDEAVRLLPDDPVVRFNHGNALRESGRPQEAIDSYVVALKRVPTYPNALNSLAVTLSEVGRHDDAIVALDRLVTVRPAWARAHVNRGIVLQALGRVDDARQAFETALSLNPDLSEAKRRLDALSRSR